MLFSTLTTGAIAMLASTALSAPSPAKFTKRANGSNFGLAIGGGRFDANYLQTFALSYANSTAWLGQIKYQSYSEPLVVSGADSSDSTSDGLVFQSIHADPNGYQSAYIVPHVTGPVGFSSPHATAPQGVRTTGWAFNGGGNLINNGQNLFYACQNAEQAAISSYQIWWWGAGKPDGVSCRGPIQIKQADPCARG